MINQDKQTLQERILVRGKESGRFLHKRPSNANILRRVSRDPARHVLSGLDTVTTTHSSIGPCVCIKSEALVLHNAGKCQASAPLKPFVYCRKSGGMACIRHLYCSSLPPFPNTPSPTSHTLSTHFPTPGNILPDPPRAVGAGQVLPTFLVPVKAGSAARALPRATALLSLWRPSTSSDPLQAHHV